MLLTLLENGVPVVAFLMMVAVGLDVTREDLRRVARQRGLVLLATAAQAILLPAAAVTIAQGLRPSSRVVEYLLLVAACPGGGMSNVYVYIARANTALSVSLTAVSCLLAAATMPIVLALYATLLRREEAFALPVWTLIGQLLAMTVIPVTLGAWIRIRRPELERQYGASLRKVCAAGVIGIVAIGVIEGSDSFSTDILAGGGAAGMLVGVGMLLGWLLGRTMRTSRADRFTLLVEFAVRNLSIALFIEVTLLGQPAFVAFGALALVFQAALLFAAIRVYRGGEGGLTPV